MDLGNITMGSYNLAWILVSLHKVCASHGYILKAQRTNAHHVVMLCYLLLNEKNHLGGVNIYL